LCAACNGTGTIRYCQDCGAEGRDFRSKRCHRCALHHTIQELRAHGDPDAVAKLEPLLRRLEQHNKPRSALTWLQRSPAAPAFRRMLRGEIPVSHEALDEHDVGPATAYLRSWLVTHGTLEPREERLARFERWAQSTLQAIGEHPDHAHLAAYARWELQPDFARRLHRGLTSASSHRHVYGKLRVAVHLTAWLHGQGLSLSEPRQSHVDAWLAGVPRPRGGDPRVRRLAAPSESDPAHHRRAPSAAHQHYSDRPRYPPAASPGACFATTRSNCRLGSAAVCRCSTASRPPGS
jgi:hypothetical protein